MSDWKPYTYEEWCESMMPLIEYDGRRWHNWGTLLNPDRQYLEDWIKGERIFLPIEANVQLRIGVDTRFIPYCNRNYSDVMEPAYLAIGADKWKLPTWESYGWNNPPPPLARD